MKRIIFTAIFFTLLISSTGSTTASSPPSIFINGNALVSPYPAVMEEGRTLVPLRAIFEALGQSVEWNPEDNSIKSGSLWLQLNNPIAQLNGSSISLDVPAKLVNERTYVPLRFVAESLGKDVNWLASQNRIEINDRASSSPVRFDINDVTYQDGEIVVKGIFANITNVEISKIINVTIRIYLINDEGDSLPVDGTFTDLPLNIKPGESVACTLTFTGVPQYSDVTHYQDEILGGEYEYIQR